MNDLEFGDVVFVKTKVQGGWQRLGRWFVGWAIRVITRSDGEGPTFANHVALVLMQDGDDYQICEALGKRGFVFTLLRERYGDTQRFGVRVARHSRLSEMNRDLMRVRINHLKHKKYGTWKVAAHATDYALTKAWQLLGGHGDIYAFRWLCRNGNYPICSWAVSDIYDRGGLPFRTPVALAQPDDLYDECDQGIFWTWVAEEVS